MRTLTYTRTVLYCIYLLTWLARFSYCATKTKMIVMEFYKIKSGVTLFNDH